MIDMRHEANMLLKKKRVTGEDVGKLMIRELLLVFGRADFEPISDKQKIGLMNKLDDEQVIAYTEYSLMHTFLMGVPTSIDDYWTHALLHFTEIVCYLSEMERGVRQDLFSLSEYYQTSLDESLETSISVFKSMYAECYAHTKGLEIIEEFLQIPGIADTLGMPPPVEYVDTVNQLTQKYKPFILATFSALQRSEHDASVLCQPICCDALQPTPEAINAAREFVSMDIARGKAPEFFNMLLSPAGKREYE